MTATDANPPPLRATQYKRGSGCWLVALASVVMAAVLLVVGLLLPPFDLIDRLARAAIHPAQCRQSGAGAGI